MADASKAGVDEDEERVLKLVLQEEERLKEIRLEVPPEEEPEELPLGSIVLALEEIDPGQTGLAVFGGNEVQIQALELIHRYANALVVVRPNLVKEYGAVSGTIKAPRRTLDDLNDVVAIVDETITDEKQVNVRTDLGDRVPRVLRILVDEDCTLAFETPRNPRTAYPEGLTGNVVLVVDNEAWVRLWVTPTKSTELKVYMSTSSAVGRE